MQGRCRSGDADLWRAVMVALNAAWNSLAMPGPHVLAIFGFIPSPCAAGLQDIQRDRKVLVCLPDFGQRQKPLRQAR